jgi:hypothetical protein
MSSAVSIPFFQKTDYWKNNNNMFWTKVVLNQNSNQIRRIYGIDITTINTGKRTITIFLRNPADAPLVSGVSSQYTLPTPENSNGAFKLATITLAANSGSKVQLIPLNLFSAPQFQKYVTKKDEFGIPYLDIPVNYELIITIPSDFSVSGNTPDTQVLVTGETFVNYPWE